MTSQSDALKLADELELLGKQATRAPWKADHDWRDGGADQVIEGGRHPLHTHTICFIATGRSRGEHQANTKLIAALRTNLPTIVAALRAAPPTTKPSGEPVAEVIEISDTMDSYTQRPPATRTIAPYKPISELPVGTKLYASPQPPTKEPK